MKAAFVILALLVIAAGCAKYQPKADPGGASWERTEETRPDGSKTVQERATFHAPQDDAKGSSFAFSGPEHPWTASGSFGGQWQPPKPDSAGSTWGQKALYGSGIACIVLAGLFLGFGRHFRLAKIAAFVGAVLIGLAVTIDRFPGIVALIIGAGFIIGGAVVGWYLWTEYKERKERGLEI